MATPKRMGQHIAGRKHCEVVAKRFLRTCRVATTPEQPTSPSTAAVVGTTAGIATAAPTTTAGAAAKAETVTETVTVEEAEQEDGDKDSKPKPNPAPTPAPKSEVLSVAAVPSPNEKLASAVFVEHR
jgi:hypothetical protein